MWVEFGWIFKILNLIKLFNWIYITTNLMFACLFVPLVPLVRPYSLGFHSLENPWKHSSLSYNPTPPKTRNIFFIIYLPFESLFQSVSLFISCTPMWSHIGHISLESHLFGGIVEVDKKSHTHINCFEERRGRWVDNRRAGKYFLSDIRDIPKVRKYSTSTLSLVIHGVRF